MTNHFLLGGILITATEHSVSHIFSFLRPRLRGARTQCPLPAPPDHMDGAISERPLDECRYVITQ
jgi:hypothetical protein